MKMELEYNEASIEVKGYMVPVRLKLSDQGIAYKNIKTGKLEQVASNEIDLVHWQRLAGAFGVRVFSSSGNLYRFGGFKESDFPQLEKCFKTMCDKTLTDLELSVKGWNHGRAKFKGGVLTFEVSSVTDFEIPISTVSGCTAGKNEVTMEFHQHDEAPVALMEMRFFIPPSESDKDPVEEFQERVMGKASVITATGDAITIFSQVQCLTPRGRYDMKFYPTFIQLHGKTFDFKITLESVIRLFLLPHLDQRQHFLVVSLDPPIKQGQTRYPHLILLFLNEDTDDIELSLTEAELKEKYGGRLEKEMSGPQFEIMSRLLKGICGRKVVTPGNFVGHSGTPAVSCSYKAAAGYLYPLERGFMYVHKPPVHIRFDEISAVNFARSGSTTRSFDFEIECKNGTMFTFSSIDKGEYHKLYDFVTSKNLRLRNKSKLDAAPSRRDAFSDSEEGEPDHYMNRVRAEAKENAEGDSDDSEEEDSDFKPGDDSDVALEYDSNAGNTSDESGSGTGGGSGGEKSPEKKKEKKKVKTVSEKPRKQRTEKKKTKDPNAPKKPQTAYFLWLADNREKIKKDNPGISIIDVSKKAGALWRNISSSEKTKYEGKAVKAKEEYNEELAKYKKSGGGVEKNATSPSKKTQKKPSVTTPSKLGSGGGYKSKEYIEDDSSSSEDSDEKPLKTLKSPKKKEKKRESEEEMISEDEKKSDSGAESDVSSMDTD